MIALQYDAAMSFNRDQQAMISLKGENYMISKTGKILKEVEKYVEHEEREKKRK
ncbi:MAG: hypothetical protein IPO02_02990 [Bacteroidetes bacterium]|nr:hypothetical protein [Bacteroidota bacterium]